MGDEQRSIGAGEPWADPGMSLRDYVAVHALASLGTWMPMSGGGNLGSKQAMEARAIWAFEQADAFIRARHKDDGDAE